MSRKKRFFKIAGISLAVILFLGYFAFSTFLFKPFEASWEHRLAGLIPRQVDFFLSKEALEEDFADFPRLAAWPQIEATQGWRIWSGSDEFKAWSEKNDFDGLIAEIDAQTEQLPMGLTPLEIFGGKEVAVAGNFDGVGIKNSRWVLSGRVGWSGKMAAAMLRYPSLLRKFSGQSFDVEETDEIFALSGGSIKTPLFVTRIQDVIVIGNDRDLVAKAPHLKDVGGMDSLASGAPYNDQIRSVEAKVDETDGLQVLLDVGKTFAAMDKTGPWPNTQSDGFTQAFLGRLIQAPSAKDVLGLVRFKNGVQIDLSGAFSTESVTPFQSRLYRVNGFERDQMLRDAARLAPADCVLFVYMHGPVSELLREVFDSVEPAMRSNIEDAVKSTGHFSSLEDLLDTIGSSLRNRMALIVCENEFGPVVAVDKTGQEFPAETDGMPVFAMTLVTWTQGQDKHAKLDEVRDMIGRNPEKFGLKGFNPSEPSDTGYYVYTFSGFQTREFWSPLIPGTGMIATLINDEGHFWITNHERMFGKIRETYYNGESSGNPRLTDNRSFQLQVNGALDNANLIVWFNPKKAGPTLRKIAKQWAADNVMNQVNYAKQRPIVEREVLTQDFGGKSIGQLSKSQVDQLQAAVDQRLTDWAEDFRAREIPYMESMDSVLLQIKLEPSKFKLALRTVVPLADE